MKVLVSILYKEFINVTQLALPVMVACYFFPFLLHAVVGKLLCALYIALYVFFINYKSSKSMINALQFKPSGYHKDYFEATIVDCGLNQDHVELRYAYTNERTALTVFNTIILDPLLWNQAEEDQELLKAKDTVNQHIVPTLPESRKISLIKTKEYLTLGAQNFIFKHELGHVYQRYSYKKLCVLALITGIATYLGLVVTAMCLPSIGAAAIAAGLICASLVDIFLSYTSNVLFTAQEEKKADFFAAKLSSAEDIHAAADFFEKQHELVVPELKKMGILSAVPSIILTGYPDGKMRAAFLRSLCKDNQRI